MIHCHLSTQAEATMQEEKCYYDQMFVVCILGGRAVLMSIIESFNYNAACVTPLQQSYNSLVLTPQCTTFILCSGTLGSPID